MLRLALLLSASTLATASPQALLTTLLKTKIPAAELPIGFSSARAEKQAMSANAKKYHAIGLVDVALKGPDAEDAFAWIVFTKHADAIADLDNPAVGNGIKVIDVVPGIKESLILTGTLKGKRITDAAAVDGNVLVQGVVVSSAVREPTAILLLKTAIAHLRRLR
ncbi:MAG TPA: hypothetical protein VGG88_04580 [Gaiellaceae bacterium]|jgi:hypothetical protein